MWSSPASSLAEAAVAVLNTAEPEAKAAMAHRAAAAWRKGEFGALGAVSVPERPARPARPELRPPREMPRRRGKGRTARIALLHAVAHIEFNAIDLAWDLIARACPLADQHALPRSFFDDWVSVGDEEATHFLKVTERLAALGTGYGDLPAHDGLWAASMDTAHDLSARLAIVPMVLEARGLDVTPDMIDKLEAIGAREDAETLREIYRDEVGHVAAGNRWFRHLAKRRDMDPATLWRELVRTYFVGAIKPPFNDEARTAAGMQSDWYESLVRPPANEQLQRGT